MFQMGSANLIARAKNPHSRVCMQKYSDTTTWATHNHKWTHWELHDTQMYLIHAQYVLTFANKQFALKINNK